MTRPRASALLGADDMSEVCSITDKQAITWLYKPPFTHLLTRSCFKPVCPVIPPGTALQLPLHLQGSIPGLLHASAGKCCCG